MTVIGGFKGLEGNTNFDKSKETPLQHLLDHHYNNNNSKEPRPEPTNFISKEEYERDPNKFDGRIPRLPWELGRLQLLAAKRLIDHMDLFTEKQRQSKQVEQMLGNEFVQHLASGDAQQALVRFNNNKIYKHFKHGFNNLMKEIKSDQNV